MLIVVGAFYHHQKKGDYMSNSVVPSAIRWRKSNHPILVDLRHRKAISRCRIRHHLAKILVIPLNGEIDNGYYCPDRKTEK